LAVEKNQALYGVVPFENSTFGTVVATLDRFITTSIKIRAETYLEVRHCFLSNSQKASVKKIYSHSEVFFFFFFFFFFFSFLFFSFLSLILFSKALGQCQKWIQANMKGVQLVNVSSTAAAAK